MKRIISFLLVLAMCFSTPISAKASNGMYVIETSYYNSLTGEKILLPEAKGEYYLEDGSAVTIDGDSTMEYYDSSREYLTYDSMTAQPMTMIIKEDSIVGWKMADEVVELEWIYDGGMWIASPKIKLVADDTISTVTVNASIEGQTTANIEMMLRSVDGKEVFQTVNTDENGVASFDAIEMGEYAVYCPELNRGWYVSADSRGEVNIVFSNTFKTSYTLTYKDKYNSDRTNFPLKVMDQNGNEIAVLNSKSPRVTLTYTEEGNEKYYISTASVPDSYSGNTLENYLITPYDNMTDFYINPDIEAVLNYIEHEKYDSLHLSSDYKLNIGSGQDLKEVLESYVEGIKLAQIRFLYSGTEVVADYAVEIPIDELIITNVDTNYESKEKLSSYYSDEEDAEFLYKIIIETGTMEFNVTAETDYGTCIYDICSTCEKETESYDEEISPFVSGLTATASGNSVKLSWNPNKYIGYYIINRIDSDGTILFSDTTTGTSYTDTGLTTGKTYSYRIDAVYYKYVTEGSEMIFKSWSSIQSVEVKAASTKPGTPVITLSNKASTGKNIVKWETVSNAEKYQVYRATSKTGTYSLVKTTTGTSYIDTKTTAGKTYYYKVRAVSADGTKGSYSSIKSRVCDCAQPVVTMSNVASTGKNKVTWKAITGATSYKVYRATSKTGTYSLVKTTTGTSYTDTKATAAKTYYYKVKAYSSKSSSATSVYSAIKSRMCDLARPTVKIALSSKKPKLTWGKISGAKSYKVYRATSKNGTYSLKKTTTSLSYRDTTATTGKTYYYKVIAVSSKSSANSAYSTVKYIKSK